MRAAQGTPVIIKGDHKGALERIYLGKSNFDERWLQQLISEYPSILPIREIEPAFSTPISVAMEVSTGHGFIDNVFLTSDGNIILVEVKLWSNVESRRKVVAQALDYVAAIKGIDYGTFEKMVLAARNSIEIKSLYEIIAYSEDSLQEAEFVDAVSLNLLHGRMLVIVLGDGIRGEARALAQLLQGHAGSHFTFALVELAVWKSISSGDIIAIPNTLTQTVMVERGIVRIENGVPTVSAISNDKAVSKPKSITAEMFDEALAKRDADLPQRLRRFSEGLESIGVYVDQRAALNLKVDVGGDTLNLGYIDKAGKIWVWVGSNFVSFEIRNRYVERLADLIGGKVVLKPYPCLMTKDGKTPSIESLIPKHEYSWREAIAELVVAARESPSREIDSF